MTNTREYLDLSERIAKASKARELHALAVELSNSNFSETEQAALRAKIRAAFGALNAAAPAAFPKGRFTLLPRAAHALLCAFCALAVQLHAAPCHSSLDTRHCIDALIGEAGNQPFATQVLVARAIRNRGSLTGVYGVNNPCVKQASARVRARALRAWNESVGTTSTSFPYKFFGCEADKKWFLRHGFKPVLKSGAITFYQRDAGPNK